MNDKWMIRGTQFANCNCEWGCPCQFSARSTNGFCEGLGVGHIEEGYFNDTKLDDLQLDLNRQVARRNRGGQRPHAGDNR